MEFVLWHVGGVTLHKTVLDCTVSGLGCTVWGQEGDGWHGGRCCCYIIIIIIITVSCIVC